MPSDEEKFLNLEVHRVIEGAAPGTIPSTWTKAGSIGSSKGSKEVEARLPFIILYNSDSVAHAITLIMNSTPGDATKISVSLASQQWLPLPTLAISSIEDANANGDVFWFYSDVGIYPRSATGGGGGNSFVSAFWGSEFGNQTLYTPFSGPQGSSSYTTDASAAVTMRVAGTVKNLFIKMIGNTLTNPSTLTLMKNGVATALTVTIPAGSTGNNIEDTAHSVTFAIGDTLSWRRVIGGAGDGANDAFGDWQAQIVA